MRYLLDTNTVSALVRDPAGVVATHVRRTGEAAVCTSIVVAAELRYGAARRSSKLLNERIEGILSTMDVLPLEVPVDAIYGQLRARLERAGTPIGGNDLLIAAHALALGHTVVTDNEREFSRIPGLPVENWLREPRSDG